jgi:hypothetical protein
VFYVVRTENSLSHPSPKSVEISGSQSFHREDLL